MKITKFLSCIALALVMLFSVTVNFGCGNDNVLTVYNCFDYIDEDLIGEFEKYYKEKTGTPITVKYDKFDTPEDAYNNIIMNPGYYDIVCPSDYMIEKMAREDMLEEFEMPEDGYYKNNVSPYIDKVFKDIKWGEGENQKSLYNYAAGYMWGTFGIVYNTAKVKSEEMTSWSSLWKTDRKFTIKNSVRDTYFVGLAKHYASELESAKNLSAEERQIALKSMFNDTDEKTVSAVKSELLTLKKRAFKLEVDDGKDMIISGDSDVYFAWSGDAVYAMFEAAESANVTLEYSVPEEGSNVWFDGWCIPKGTKQKDAAIEFIDFLSKPENAVANMEYIGYVSVIAGNTVFEYVKNSYNDDNGNLSVDLSYFFGDGGNYTVNYSNKYGIFAAQYPSKEVIDRCVVMNYFSDDANERINTMWSQIIVG